MNGCKGCGFRPDVPLSAEGYCPDCQQAYEKGVEHPDYLARCLWIPVLCSCCSIGDPVYLLPDGNAYCCDCHTAFEQGARSRAPALVLEMG